MHSYERTSEENVGLGLEDLAEDSEEDDKAHNFKEQNGNPHYNGTHKHTAILER